MKDELREIIMNHIGTGPDSATTTAALMRITGLSNRDLRQAIRELRLEGELICSRTDHGGGYFLPENLEDLNDFLRSMSHRGRAVFSAATGARKAIRKAEQGESETSGKEE